MLWNTGIYTTSHPTEIAAIDNESVSCRNSRFPSTQAASRSGGTGVSREHQILRNRNMEATWEYCASLKA